MRLRLHAFGFATLLTAACATVTGSEVGSATTATEDDAGPAGTATGVIETAPAPTFDASMPPAPPPVEQTVDAAVDSAVPLPPYECKAPPAQCKLSCTDPSCTRVCDEADPTACHWDCAVPICTCTDEPTATCTLNTPTAVCDQKCEKPECEILCPECTTLPCEPCETLCKQPHCVTHCQAPKIEAQDGGRRVVHCQAPKPSCSSVCEPVNCTHERQPACPDDGGACPPLEGYTTSCEPPKCHTECEPLPAAKCDVRGCDEACDALGSCTVECPTDDPNDCRPTCSGGACHVTSCE